MSQAASNTSDTRMQVLAAANVAMSAKTAMNVVKAGQGSTISGKDNQIATGAKNADGTLKTNPDGTPETRDASAADQIGGINVSISLGSSSSKSGSVGISIGTSGFGVTLAASQGRGNADGSDVTWSNTQVNAGQQALLSSGSDTTLKGAVVAAPQITANIQGNLAIQSLSDTSTYASKQSSLGGSLIIGAGISANINAGNSKTHSDYTSVTEQSGFKAGDQGFNVNVASNTTLTGAAITSTQKAIDDNQNHFSSAGTLTTSDLQNQASYNAQSVGINLGNGFDPTGALTPQGTSAGIGQDSGDANSTTVAAISGSAGNKAARTGDDQKGIQQIFDADEVQKDINAQVLITQAFGREASKAVGDYANTKAVDLRLRAAQEIDPTSRQALLDQAASWEEGGSNRVVLHAVIGGLTGGVNGALGAGSSATATPILAEGIAKLSIPTEAKLVLIEGLGAAIGAATGGTAGAVSGFNETANNQVQFLRMAAQLAQRAAQVGIDKLDKVGTVTLQACVANPTCLAMVQYALPVGAAAWLLSQNNKEATQPSAVDLIPTGYAGGPQPQPQGPLVTTAADPHDTSTTTPSDVKGPEGTPGYAPTDPVGDSSTVTQNPGPQAGSVVMSENNYVSSPKHDPLTGWGTPMDLSDKKAQDILNKSVAEGKQRYGFANGTLYEFQPDNAGGSHGYPIPGNEAPIQVLRGLRDSGEITNSQFNQMRRGK